jgi:hypothetical protein
VTPKKVPDREGRPGLLIFFAPADHPHRDAVCATLAWVAAAEGLLFECYYDSRPSGVHYGGGLPWRADPADLRGGTFTGGHHLEQFELLLKRFNCQAACLGATVFADALADAGIPIRATAPEVGDFYHQLFQSSKVTRPKTLLVIGNVQGQLSLAPYACHEIVQRRLIALSAGDEEALEKIKSERPTEVEYVWNEESTSPVGAASVADRSLAMAARWSQHTNTFLIADPEAAGRWIPAAIRNGWAPVFGIPQADLVTRLSTQLQTVPVVWGRQQDDRDFLALSQAGVAFQLVDPGRPPFPIMGEAARPRPPAAAATAETPTEPTDDELRRWARERRIVSTMVFWTGMVRELECLYALAEILSLTRLKAGLALTVESFNFVDSTPLALLSAAAELGGLRGQVETLLASAGAGGMIESAAPPERFARTLADSVTALARTVGEDQLPKGWWGVMDAPLLRRRIGRVKLATRPPSIKLRYRRRSLAAQTGMGPGGGRPDLRARIRESPLGNLFEPIRPFDESRPGRPVRSILEAVKAAGFEYALTKAEFGAPPTMATGVDGLSVLNYTAGRWDGWTPFETVNELGDLVRAERRLLRSKKPGWLLGGIDSCLWTFSGHVWDRGRELRDMCRWMAGGGSSGELVNVTPGTAARYARVLANEGLIRTTPAR